MIQLLSKKYQWFIAYCFFLVFFTSTALPAYAMNNNERYRFPVYTPAYNFSAVPTHTNAVGTHAKTDSAIQEEKETAKAVIAGQTKEEFIGGPSQPEMSRFKSAGSDNLVNLFTGDFNYNIPLMDVGGYPVNIFYDAGITPEQEASWVGLGWNINPGTVNRNMRGVPDDFNGDDKLTTVQAMKPNITWGGRLGGDLEVTGLKDAPKLGSFGSLGGSLGGSVNNYLGPSLELGIKGGMAFKVADLSGAEKNAKYSKLSIGAGLNANLSSRGGLTIAPNVSLTASKELSHIKSISGGVGASTSYNSRTGISNLNLNGQFALSVHQEKESCDEKTNTEVYSVRQNSSISPHILSSSISFAKPSYSPGIRMPVTNKAFSGHFQLGGGLWALYASAEVEVYRNESFVDMNDRTQIKPMVGYLYYDKANNNQNSLVDFTRFNDKEVTPGTPVISAPQYTYDVFSINGEGTGGSIRLYRNDYGYVRDNFTSSRSKSAAVGADVSVLPMGHYGANVNIIKTPSTIGEWTDGNKLRTAIPFKPTLEDKEMVYFRNPGETSVLDNNQFAKIGGTDLVRFKLGGTAANPTIEPILERFSSDNTKLADVNMQTTAAPSARKKRTQVVSYLTAKEASDAGLNKMIRTYNGTQPLNPDNTLSFRPMSRIDEFRKPHHISEIDVTEANGMRYIYDLPVYNIIQQDFTFTVPTADPDADLVNDPDMASFIGENSAYLGSASRKDGFLQANTTPAYAHSFLLGGLLSPDYVDVKDDGITEDDLGTAVKFNYTRIENSLNGPLPNRWKTPLGNQSNTASFNPGNRTEEKDDKGNISYGERESWYLHSIESKTLIAIFTLEERKDAKGPTGITGGISGDNAAKRLKKIDLYNKADLHKNGLTGATPARPIKTVFFEYSYRLCKNASDNIGGAEYKIINGVQTNEDVNINKGRLTLEGIYFTYNGQERANKDRYKFAYENASGDNPDYAMNNSDRWGNYKPSALNPGGLKNATYPYSFQPKEEADQNVLKKNAGAWNLKKILLPSGGQLEVDYESDDYAFVQDRRASVMMSVAGLGSSSSAFGDELYTIRGNSIEENNYVLINVSNACDTKEKVFESYLKGQEQLAFRLAVQMPKGYEFMTSYGIVDGDNYGVYGSPADKKIWVKLKKIDGRLSPLSVTALEYLKEQLPGQAFTGYDVSEGTALEQFGKMLAGMINGLSDAFEDPVSALKWENKARRISLQKSFVRLNEPAGHKYGGGHRVKQVVLKDNWKAMTNQYTSTYGTVYDYTTTETFNGAIRPISSGVASYEPSIGGEENPFQTMLQVVDRLPLGPSSYGAIEMPVLDAFFPAPLVGYSKVTVTSFKRGTPPSGQKSRSGVGRQVTEFYTAKDFPVKYQYTSLTPSSDVQLHQNSFGAFLWKWALDFRSISQGFVVTVNDMHGKMKSQSSYAENDPTQRISYTENFYRNTGEKSMADEKFSFVSGIDGKIEEGNMGIDVELMTDTREFRVKSTSQELQAQLDYFPIPLPPGFLWLPFPWYVNAKSEDVYRAVTCTKYVSYHSIVDKVIVIDKGSQVETQNLVYDGETGDVIVNRTNNEFNEGVYSTKYPAYWGYRGMGLAYKNIGATYKNVTFSDGRINLPETSIFESGDELYVHDGVQPDNDCDVKIASDDNIKRIWVYDQNKNNVNDEAGTAAISTRDLIFLDKEGRPYTRKNVDIQIIRSGKRNLLQSSVQSLISMASTIQNGYLKVEPSTLAINASAMEFKEKWQTDNDVIQLTKTMLIDCENQEVLACDGDHLEKNINPYVKGLLGNFRPYRSMVFYGDRSESDATASTNIYRNGYLKDFANYWNFTSLSPSGTKFMLNQDDHRWVWNTQSTRFNGKGLELETKDALDIYTAAQYGYNKSVAVAIASNARYNEMFFEGFEDNSYNARVNGNGSPECSNYRHVNFGTNGITSTDGLGFAAHSGKYVMSVNQNSSRSFVIPVKPNVTDGFEAQLATTTPQTLSDIGANIGDKSFSGFTGDFLALPYSVMNSSTGLDLRVPALFSVQTTGGSETCGLLGPFSSSTAHATYTINESHYFEITEGGYYYLTIGLDQTNGGYARVPAAHSAVNNVGTSFIVEGTWDSDLSGCNSVHEKLSSLLTITDQNDYPINFNIVSIESSMNSSNAAVIEVCLPRGYYKVNSANTADYTSKKVWNNSTPPSPNIEVFAEQRFTFTVENTSTPNLFLPIYKTTTASPACSYTEALAGSETMLNPLFTPAHGSKMAFSAWVRESCETPCNLNTYSKNKVRISFEGSGTIVEMTPAGPIVEGWQRYESYFEVPASGVTNMNLSFVNTSSGSIYFDDIRMHPFNSNMQSYVYDPVNLRLTAQLDANNYATFFEYDEEGGLIRKKVETKEGVKTLMESRSAKQKTITDLQP